MKMHEMRTVNIDEPVNAYLSRWKLLTPKGRESDASIRSILSHTAGIVDGEDSFHGLRMGDPEISLLAILDGETKYNNRPVRGGKTAGDVLCVFERRILRAAADDAGCNGQDIRRRCSGAGL